MQVPKFITLETVVLYQKQVQIGKTPGIPLQQLLKLNAFHLMDQVIINSEYTSSSN